MMEQSRRYGQIDMDALLDTLDLMRDEPPQGEDVLDFLLDFFRYLEQENISLSIASEGPGENSRYGRMARKLTELACWEPEHTSFRLYEELLTLVCYILRPESRADLQIQQKLDRVRELLTLLQFYRESQPWEFEQALEQYLSETVEKIRDAMWMQEPPPQTRKRIQTLERELERSQKNLILEKARADRLQQQLDTVTRELEKMKRAGRLLP